MTSLDLSLLRAARMCCRLMGEKVVPSGKR